MKRCLSNGQTNPLKKLSLDASWQSTLPQVIKNVVSIHFSSITPFDTEDSYVSEATGFVVDPSGIIMTNRHVVGPGPFCGYAIFDNHEECPVKAVYRDPVHDFGFLKFDPSQIKFLDFKGLSLRPDLARVGSDIRVVGNDAGEKLSILSGVISRLDRNAPDYGELSYNDFNTEYIQAAASASGGSSGSPVVDCDGNVLALQAGGATSASTDFFLPLFRAKRALECLQKNEPITRGTVQVQWLLKPFDECKRLGLTDASLAKVREHFPAALGLLVAEMVLPGGPASSFVEEGDILLEVDGRPISSFQTVDEILDSNVDNLINFTIERSGRHLSQEIKVMDLHAITPSQFVEFSGAVFHNVSYQIARLYGIPCSGVYIADAGLGFYVNRDKTGWILLEINNTKVNNIEEFVGAVRDIPDRSQIPAKLVHVTDLYTIRTLVVPVDRHWSKKLRIATRNDSKGVWEFETVGEPKPPVALTPQTARHKSVNISGKAAACSRLVKAFVRVETMLPFRVEGYTGATVSENGIVINASKGLVLVCRFCVPHRLCDITITVADSVMVPAKVVFLHPQQNFAIIQFDPALVQSDMESVQFSTEYLKQGDEVMFIGFNNHRMVLTETCLTGITTISIPQSHEFSPRYRATNLESLGFDAPMIGECSSGLLADYNGLVRGVWLSFMGDVQDRRDRQFRMALDSVEIGKIVRKLESDGEVDPRFLDLELGSTPIVHARVNGVSEKWVQQLHEMRPQFCIVLRVSHSLAEYVYEGDIVLAADGKLVSHSAQLQNLDSEFVNLTVVRNGQEIEVRVPTTKSSDVLISRVVLWSGMLIHAPHHSVLQQIKNVPSQVYIANISAASPANHRGIGPTQFITHVDGVPTPTLSEFYEAVKNLEDEKDVRLRIVSFDAIPSAVSIRTNYHYFSTSMLELKGDEWVKV